MQTDSLQAQVFDSIFDAISYLEGEGFVNRFVNRGKLLTSNLFALWVKDNKDVVLTYSIPIKRGIEISPINLGMVPYEIFDPIFLAKRRARTTYQIKIIPKGNIQDFSEEDWIYVRDNFEDISIV